MGGVFLIQYPVADAQALKRAAAVGGERQPQVVAIDALVDLHRTKLKFARPLGAGQIEMAQHVGLERGPLARSSPQLTLPSRSRSRPTASSPSRIASSREPDTSARSTCRLKKPLLAM